MLPVANIMLPRQRQVLARFSVSALVASLPLLYVSLRRPPAAALAGDTAFWFLMSNCVIAAIVAADDAGTLFFGSEADRSSFDDGGGDDDNISYVAGGQPAVAFEDSRGAAVPFLSSNDDAPTAVHMDGGRIQEELASTMTSGNSIVASSTDLSHASVVLRRAEEDLVAIEPDTHNHKNDTVKFQEQGEEVARFSSRSASDEAIPGADDLAITKANSGALARPEPEPWPSDDHVTSLSFVEEAEEEAPKAWAIAQRSRTPDLQQGKGVVAAGEGKLRRSATEGSKPAAAEESEYWELSDEELNKKVEEFIARFNREMRRQIEEEAGVL